MGINTSREWLVADRRGAFAMGSSDGFRFRKYHGFFMGIPGRSETAFLTDLELVVDGLPLWPHCYRTPEGVLIFPDPLKDRIPFHFELTEQGGPRWTWRLSAGEFRFWVEGREPGGIRLQWSWSPSKQDRKKSVQVLIRPLCGMRNLHWMGGRSWRWESREAADGKGRARIVTESGGNWASELHCKVDGPLVWKDEPVWYYNFHYSEESRRGYASDEDLFSAGFFDGCLEPGQSASLTLAEDPNDLAAERPRKAQASRSLDFILTRPAGIVAGFPWFGEWARDTFISLPGVVASWLASGESSETVWEWTRELFSRWAEWIHRDGMLPNLIGGERKPQWESADGTLWFCHALASLWTFAKAEPGFFGPIGNLHLEFQGALARAIESIRDGHHRYLRVAENGLLYVTESHSTWMDARVEGRSATPRVGLLPEINALWFQARCLHTLWREPSADFSELERLGRLALDATGEEQRPNRVFLHSVPLAPSFVLRDSKSLAIDVSRLAEKFWTPVGLRTLDPRDPNYKSHCVGTQEERDRAYHQGPVWAWLGGHFEMARHRLGNGPDKMFPPQILAESPIEGHIPELFDAEAPFSARGTPAQAWSIACLDESEARRKLRVDAKITEILAERWTDRTERKRKKSRLGRGIDQAV